MHLTDLIQLQRPLLFFDLETTGPNPNVDRIVEIGLIQFRPDGTSKEWRTLVNPEMPIPAGSTEKHGIDDERMTKCNRCAMAVDAHPHRPDHDEPCEEFQPIPTFKDIAGNLIRGFTDTDFGGYNVRNFDLPVMAAEFTRVGITTFKYDTAKVLCGFRLWQVAEPRSLSDFVERWTGEKLENAHTALADIVGTVIGIKSLLETATKLPRDLASLHDLCFPVRPKDANSIDDTGKFVWKDGVACVNFGKKWNGKPIHQVNRRFWEWMVDPAQNFPADAVQIARDAMAGKLPQKEKQDALPLATE